MAKFKVIAKMVTTLELELEADTLEEAEAMAADADGGDFTEDEYGSDWQIYSVTPLSPEPKGKIIQADGWMLVHMDTLEPVREFDWITSFRGGEYLITGGNPPHKPSSTGRVYVTGGVEFFPTVFSLKWIKATTH